MLELRRGALWSLALIAIVIGVASAAFAYTAGWLSPNRLTPGKLVAALAPPGGPALGHRRNHAKGICFTGVFDANGAGSELSVAPVFARGQYPVVGRFNLGTPNPDAADATVRVRGLGISISTPDGQEWRSAMIDPPMFPVPTPQSLLRTAARVREQGPECDQDIRRGPSRIRSVRRVGQDCALAPQLRGRAVQQPQQLCVHRQGWDRTRRALVAAARGQTGGDNAR